MERGSGEGPERTRPSLVRLHLLSSTHTPIRSLPSPPRPSPVQDPSWARTCRKLSACMAYLASSTSSCFFWKDRVAGDVKNGGDALGRAPGSTPGPPSPAPAPAALPVGSRVAAPRVADSAALLRSRRARRRAREEAGGDGTTERSGGRAGDPGSTYLTGQLLPLLLQPHVLLLLPTRRRRRGGAPRPPAPPLRRPRPPTSSRLWRSAASSSARARSARSRAASRTSPRSARAAWLRLRCRLGRKRRWGPRREREDRRRGDPVPPPRAPIPSSRGLEGRFWGEARC